MALVTALAFCCLDLLVNNSSDWLSDAELEQRVEQRASASENECIVCFLYQWQIIVHNTPAIHLLRGFPIQSHLDLIKSNM